MTVLPAVIRPMRPRDPGEPHRVASPLELLTDLCFVVAVAQASTTFHHAITENHLGEGLLGFVFAFFGVWWTWLNFSWFASAYDNDDLVYRLLTILQIVGSLVLAVGVPTLLEDNTIAVIGYVIMRIALVLQWLRAGGRDRERRTTCLRYAAGITVVQALWVVSVFLPRELVLPAFVIVVAAEFAVPAFAERTGGTPWHAHHIAERYGLFFIIVLGETVLSVATGIENALSATDAEFTDLVTLAAGGVLIVFSVWWIYFSRPAAPVLERHRRSGSGQSYLWGFGHYLVFASTAAVGAALAARVDYRTHEGHPSSLGSAAVLTVAVAVLLASVWALQLRQHDRTWRTAVPFAVAVVAVLASTVTPVPELAAGLICAGLLAVEIRVARLGPSAPD